MIKTTNKKTIGISVFLFLIFLFFVYLFPYSGDDWAWGSQVGLDRLLENFDNYNGRYVGNLLVMVLTRSKFINMVFTGISLVCVCLFPKIFSSTKSTLPYLFGITLFFLIPTAMFEQTIVWTSGFTNYVPSILLVFIYFILIKDLFEKDTPPKFHWLSQVAAFFIGFVSSLFMENVTLYNVAISFIIIAFTIYKYKKIFLINILYSVSSLIGTIVMFTNSAYSTIAKGEDFYRTSGLNSGIINTALDQSKIIFEHFVENNFFFLLILSFLCATLYFSFIKNNTNNKLKTLGFEYVVAYTTDNGISVRTGIEQMQYKTRDISVKVKALPVYVEYKAAPNVQFWTEARFDLTDTKEHKKASDTFNTIYTADRNCYTLGARYTF